MTPDTILTAVCRMFGLELAELRDMTCRHPKLVFARWLAAWAMYRHIPSASWPEVTRWIRGYPLSMWAPSHATFLTGAARIEQALDMDGWVRIGHGPATTVFDARHAIAELERALGVAKEAA